MIGKTLAHYEITEKIGAGGMGEVYRATDSKLGRDVALKVLPADVAGDQERMARFQREAQLLASLNHPNIGAIYGIESSGDTTALVLELIEGPTLFDRLRDGPLPTEEASAIARQIAEAVEFAHEHGVIHRDLKPANVKVTEDGRVKVLDFGLAKAMEDPASSVSGTSNPAESPTISPTLQSPITGALTAANVILGTASYMSPEQARGRHVDRRSDIWAFGVILWEMVTGRRLFDGETVSDTLAAVLRAEPEWEQLPVDDAPVLCRLIERCLVRDPQQRLRDIGEARILLQEGGSGQSLLSTSASTSATTAPTDRPGGSRRLAWFAFVGVALVAAAFAALYFTRPSGPTVTQTTLGLPPDAAIEFAGGTAWSCHELSPDGKSVVYLGGFPGDLYLRAIDSFEATKIPDTQGAQLPVFSPDGRWIAYNTGQQLWKIAVSGGAPVKICDTLWGPGLAWGNGELYFSRSHGGGLWAVSENGGEPRQVSTPDDARDEVSHRWPHVLPDGRHLLLTIKTAQIETFDDASIGLLSLESGDVTVLLQGGSNPRYAPTGHLIYGRNSRLLAVPFDLKTLSTQGTPTPVLDGVQTSDLTGSAFYALSPEGHLAYAPHFLQWDNELTWVHRSGKISPIEWDHRRAFESSVSPDGTRFAAAVPQANDKIWVYDLERKTASRLTNTPGNDRNPVWSRDGEWIVYENDRSGISNLFLIRADGSAPAEKLLSSEATDYPSSWSPDGTGLLFTRFEPGGEADIWILDMTGDRQAAPFLRTSHDEGDARFSPSGKWVAYQSDSSGDREVYVRPFAGPGNPIRISRSGGGNPRWSKDGTTLYYSIDDRLMSVAIDQSAGFRAGEPEELLTLDESMFGTDVLVSPAADGERFLTTRLNPESKLSQIRVIFDWTDRLEGPRP